MSDACPAPLSSLLAARDPTALDEAWVVSVDANRPPRPAPTGMRLGAGSPTC
ncbi:MAG TPA: hypothetical protein VFW03_06015 [Gemmatimonadaceae bacterium]|nr:hypothetical protein [Gemmatimonadaceae bacterium]